MRVRLRFFAALKDIVGSEILEWEAAEGFCLKDLRIRLEQAFPRLQNYPLILAVDGEPRDGDFPLSEGVEICLLPPFSGGSAELTTAPISPQDVIERVKDRSCGALAVFIGTVRSPSQGREVRYLEYEAYQEMAQAKLAQIEKEVKERWGVKGVAISHRLGHLDVGEIAVVIAVSSPHREEAFEACRYIIERIKQIVPIWKKEVFVDGESWVLGGATSASE